MRRSAFLALFPLSLAGPPVSAELIENRRPPSPVGQLITKDDYPPAALRAGAEGRTVARLAISAQGRVTDCVVTSSSGNADLDAATCRAAVRATWRPALDDDGKPVSSTYTLPVRWALPKPAEPVEVAAMPPNLAVALELKVGTDGRVLSCRVLQSTLPAGDNPCGTLPVGQQLQPPLLRNGRPVGATVTQRFSREVTPDP